MSCVKGQIARQPENPTCCVIRGELPEFLKGSERDKHGLLFTADGDEVGRQLLQRHNFIETTSTNNTSDGMAPSCGHWWVSLGFFFFLFFLP